MVIVTSGSTTEDIDESKEFDTGLSTGELIDMMCNYEEVKVFVYL